MLHRADASRPSAGNRRTAMAGATKLTSTCCVAAKRKVGVCALVPAKQIFLRSDSLASLPARSSPPATLKSTPDVGCYENGELCYESKVRNGFNPPLRCGCTSYSRLLRRVDAHSQTCRSGEAHIEGSPDDRRDEKLLLATAKLVAQIKSPSERSMGISGIRALPGYLSSKTFNYWNSLASPTGFEPDSSSSSKFPKLLSIRDHYKLKERKVG